MILSYHMDCFTEFLLLNYSRCSFISFNLSSDVFGFFITHNSEIGNYYLNLWSNERKNKYFKMNRSTRRYISELFIFLQHVFFVYITFFRKIKMFDGGVVFNLYGCFKTFKNYHFQTSSLKKKMAKSAQTFTPYLQTPNFKSRHLKSWIKPISYTLPRRICTLVTNENLRKSRLKELHITFD